MTPLSQSDPAAALRLGEVSKSFGHRRGGVQALRNVSLTVRPGEHVGVVGASGAGKSTLAAIAAGLEQPDTGQVIIDGRDVTSLRGTARRRLGARRHLIFQDPYAALPPGHRVDAVIAEPLVIHGLARGEQLRRRVHEALEEVALSPAEKFCSKRTDELSGGERQRVALARAVIGRPALLIADEPTALLDAALRTELLALLANLADRLGLAVVHITHDLALAGAWAHRLVVLDHGEVVEEGSPEQVLWAAEAPATIRLRDAALRLHAGYRG
ncbi:MAG: ABC transporter ATP-binding protein [Euzebya sp.]